MIENPCNQDLYSEATSLHRRYSVPVKQQLVSAWVRTPSLTADHFHSPPVVSTHNYRVGQSTSTPLYPWFTVVGGGLGFGTMVRRQACKPKVGVFVGSYPLADS